tara:strand:- start:229 stop:516 length:288 start_codon:yes stop_codon:yes gene_type:complete
LHKYFCINKEANCPLFYIDCQLLSRGSLSFISKPDFENALDADSDNSYEVTVSAKDNEGNKSEQAFTVMIENRIDKSSSKILKVKGQEKKIFFKG